MLGDDRSIFGGRCGGGGVEDGNWSADQPPRAASNNSAAMVRTPATRAQFPARFEPQKHDGEPGFYRKSNPPMIEPSVYDPNGRTEVITFPVEGPDFGIDREDLSAVKHVDYARLV